MGKTINETETARTFSEIVNSVKYRGETYTIISGGKPVAALVPIGEVPSGRTLKELGAIVDSLPKLGMDVDACLKDVAWELKPQPSSVGDESI